MHCMCNLLLFLCTKIGWLSTRLMIGLLPWLSRWTIRFDFLLFTTFIDQSYSDFPDIYYLCTTVTRVTGRPTSARMRAPNH